MARDGNGVYSLPAAVNPVVAGTVITDDWGNDSLDDIATALTNSIAKDGQTVITGDLDFNGNDIILDQDGDTKFVNGTDDTIGVTIAGASDFTFTANTFTALSGSTIKANTIAETTNDNGVVVDGLTIKDGEARQEKIDVFLPASAFKPDSTDPCANLASNDIGALEQSYLAFDKDSDEKANIQIMAPPYWDGGDIEVYVYWTSPTATTSGDAVWVVNMEATANAEALNGTADDSDTVTDSHNGADNLNISGAISFSTLGYSALELLTIQIVRNANAGGDTLDSDAWLVGVRVKFA